MAHTLTEEQYEKEIKKRLQEFDKKNMDFIEYQWKYNKNLKGRDNY